jgi:hypothetical protein
MQMITTKKLPRRPLLSDSVPNWSTPVMDSAIAASPEMQLSLQIKSSDMHVLLALHGTQVEDLNEVI